MNHQHGITDHVKQNMFYIICDGIFCSSKTRAQFNNFSIKKIIHKANSKFSTAQMYIYIAAQHNFLYGICCVFLILYSRHDDTTGKLCALPTGRTGIVSLPQLLRDLSAQPWRVKENQGLSVFRCYFQTCSQTNSYRRK